MVRKGGLLELLTEHGVPEPAARIYLAAMREGPLTVAELARAAAIHRVHGYRFIEELQARGLLRGEGARPRRFSALPVEELLDRYASAASEELERLTRERPQLLDEASDPRPGPAVPEGRRFSVIEGQSAIHAFLRKRFGSARREVLISVAGFALARAIDGGLDRALKEARARGVKVRLVTEAGPSNLAEVQLFVPAAEIRHAQRPVTSRAVLIDRGQAAIFVSGEDGLGTTGDAQVLLVTSDPHFLALTREYHQRLWSHSVPVAERLVELEGPLRAQLPAVAGQMDETFNRLREITELGMAATGLQELSMDLSELIEAVGKQLGEVLGDRIEGHTPPELARSLAEYYAKNARGRLSVVREKPLTLKVADCFACRNSPEIGRVLCPALLRAAFERRLGGDWDVSKPDPRHHASRGCLFAIGPA